MIFMSLFCMCSICYVCVCDGVCVCVWWTMCCMCVVLVCVPRLIYRRVSSFLFRHHCTLLFRWFLKVFLICWSKLFRIENIGNNAIYNAYIILTQFVSCYYYHSGTFNYHCYALIVLKVYFISANVCIYFITIKLSTSVKCLAERLCISSISDVNNIISMAITH